MRKNDGGCGESLGRSARRLLLPLLAMGFLALTTMAHALELPIGVKPGEKKKLLPRLRAAVTVGGDYSDNVNTSPGRNSKGMRLRVTPEVHVEFPDFNRMFSQSLHTRKLYVEGGYRYGYLGVNGRKIDFHRNAHTANAGLRYGLSNKASLGSQYVFQRDQYPFAAAGDTYTLNDVNTQLKMELTRRLTWTPYYKFQNFSDTGLDGAGTFSAFNDYGDNKVGWDTSYRISPKVSIIGNSEYEHKAFRKSQTKDFWSYGGKGGLAVQLTHKISAQGLGGYGKRYFDTGKDLGSALWDAQLQYVPSRKLVTTLFYNYDQEDTFTTEFLQEKASPSLVDFLPRNYRAINVQRMGAKIGFVLTDKDRVDTGFTYQFARADSGQDVTIGAAHKKLDEKDYEFSLNYAHAFTQWMNLALGYSNIGRNTNIADNFRANVVSFGLRLGW